MKIEGEAFSFDDLVSVVINLRDIVHAQGERVQPDVETIAFAIGTAGPNVIIPAQSARLLISSYILSANGAVAVTPGYTRGSVAAGAPFEPFPGFNDPTNNADFQGTHYLGANGGAVVSRPYPNKIFEVPAGMFFAFNLGANVKVGGLVSFWVA